MKMKLNENEIAFIIFLFLFSSMYLSIYLFIYYLINRHIINPHGLVRMHCTMLLLVLLKIGACRGRSCGKSGRLAWFCFSPFLDLFCNSLHVEHAVLLSMIPICLSDWAVHARSVVFQDFPWIVADEQEVHMQGSRLIPLKTMTSDIVKVRLILTLTLYLMRIIIGMYTWLWGVNTCMFCKPSLGYWLAYTCTVDVHFMFIFIGTVYSLIESNILYK